MYLLERDLIWMIMISLSNVLAVGSRFAFFYNVVTHRLHLLGSTECELCRDLYNISAEDESELVLAWNLIVNFIHKTDLLRILGKFPPDVRYGTVIDLIPTLSDDERELVRRFMNEYYPSPAKTNCSVDELLRGECASDGSSEKEKLQADTC